MTISLYTGVPGSGKSLDAAALVRYNLNRPSPRPVIANFALGVDAPVKPERRQYFVHKPNAELTPDFLIDFATKFWTAAPDLFAEDYLLIVIDEVQLLMNSRRWNVDKNRMNWLEFLSQHRKYGYRIILIAQSAKMIDNQFRMLVDTEVNHRKLSGMGILGWLLSLPFRDRLFMKVRYLYQTGERLGCDLSIGLRRDMRMYDSYARFEQVTSPDMAKT